MKIEDIKPGDVIVRTEDKILFKVVEVTPEGEIMQSANGKMNEVFCIFQEPKTMSFCSEEDYEPATEEQRQYMESKLAAFYGTNPEVESKRFAALATMMGDLKQENNELAERVKELMSDYNNVVKQLHPQPVLSELTEAPDKNEELERENESLCKQLQSLQKSNDLLHELYDTKKAKLKKAKEELEEYLDDIFTLQKRNAAAENLIARFENADIEHADFSTMAFDCPHGVEAKVCSAECLGCEHCLTHGNTGTRSILCAYNYDKKKEKEQHLDKFYEQMNRYFNEK
mgnify:CR=1 FL=1